MVSNFFVVPVMLKICFKAASMKTLAGHAIFLTATDSHKCNHKRVVESCW
jgi:hypothetical protein